MLFAPRRSLPSDCGRVVKTWPNDVELKDMLVVQCFLFLSRFPRRKVMLSIATLPWENEMGWHTITACPQASCQVSTSSFH